jgi:hypothetical protein
MGQRIRRFVTILINVVVEVLQHRNADAAKTLLTVKHMEAKSDSNSTIIGFYSTASCS